MRVDAERPHDLPLTAWSPDGVDLLVGGCSIRELVARFGTPLYVLDGADIDARATAFRSALGNLDRPGRCVFASKALPVVGVLERIHAHGIGADVASGGELAIALAAGVDPATIISHGNARTTQELAAAVDVDVGLFVLDGPADVERLDQVARGSVDVLVRIAPGIAPATHESMATAHEGQKFGVAMQDVAEVVAAVRARPNVRFRGYHVHVGSQVCDLGPFAEAVERLASLGPVEILDLGGGLGIPLGAAQETPSIAGWVDHLGQAMGAAGVDRATELIVEPGRSLVGLAGLTVHTVQTVKRTGGTTFVAVDGGTADNSEAVQRVRAQRVFSLGDGSATERVDLVGMHCDSGDVLARDIELADPSIGALVVSTATGAYAHATASNYNAVLRPPVVLCEDGVADELVRRETLTDLLHRQRPTAPREA